MLKGGLMIRLIDIVFILLFGFISISEIGPQHSIEPPKTTHPRPEQDEGQQVLFIGITRPGLFIIETPNGVTMHSSDIEQVKKLLAEIGAKIDPESTNLMVHICSNWDAPIKYAMRVTDICDTYKIPKALIVRKIEKPI